MFVVLELPELSNDARVEGLGASIGLYSQGEKLDSAQPSSRSLRLSSSPIFSMRALRIKRLPKPRIPPPSSHKSSIY